jgi:hypothetical protein
VKTKPVSSPEVAAPKPRPRSERPLTADEIAAFNRDGYVILRGFLSPEEVEPLREKLLGDPTVGGRVGGVMDSDGNAQEIVGWTKPSDTWIGKVAFTARFIDAAEAILGQPSYHWHSKLSMKRPHAPGRWDWHQDYPYWYKEGALWPDMLTITVAVDRCDEDNGCLQLVRGSHKLGRVDHMEVGHAYGFDPERLALVQQQLPTDSMVMEVGDAVIFHGNTLHASGPNNSDRPRTLLHCSYNTIVNSPFITEGQERHLYRPFEVQPDSSMRTGGYTELYNADTWPVREPRKPGARSHYGYKSVATV